MKTYHPDAAADLFPALSQDELLDLGLDIEANGLRDPIKLDHTGKFLVDGGNREQACALVGVTPRYECLPVDTDIFAYVVSANLRRRHLTDAQRQVVIRKIAERNPTLSHHELAKIVGANQSTISRALRSTDADASVEHKTVGADGKSRPASGKISAQKRAAIISAIKAGTSQREIALKYSVSTGSVANISKSLKASGELVTAHRPTIAEQLAKRATNLPRYDTMSREERGMGSPEYGAEQHPDYPKGWTRDHVHREEYGRIQLYPPKEHAERKIVKRFEKVIITLNNLVTDAPSRDDVESIRNPKSREMITFQLAKLGPQALSLITDYLIWFRAENRAEMTG